MLTNAQVRDIETLVHPYTNLATHRENGPLILDRAQGVRVYDGAGKDYIEGMAGLWCASLGYGNEELAETAAAQMRKLSFTHLFSAAAMIRRSSWPRSSRSSRRCRSPRCSSRRPARKPMTAR